MGLLTSLGVFDMRNLRPKTNFFFSPNNTTGGFENGSSSDKHIKETSVFYKIVNFALRKLAILDASK